jgi:cytidylate kinase
MAVITISRQFGAGGETLGRMIADELEYTFADREIIQKITEAANVSPNWVKLVESEGGTRLNKLVTKLVSQRWIDRVLGTEQGYLDEKIYIDYLVLIIAQLADEGDVVILGRGSQYILNDHPEAFNILLIDEAENRAKFLIENYKVSLKKATRSIKTEDLRRDNLYKKLGKTDYDDPTLYHMVLNMGKVNLDTALKLVCTMVKS